MVGTAQTCVTESHQQTQKFSMLTSRRRGSQSRFLGAANVERFLFLLNILPCFFFFFKHLDAL